jgi:hypothetical protein
MAERMLHGQDSMGVSANTTRSTFIGIHNMLSAQKGKKICAERIFSLNKHRQVAGSEARMLRDQCNSALVMTAVPMRKSLIFHGS